MNCHICANFIPYQDTGCKLRVSNKEAECMWEPKLDFSGLIEEKKKAKLLKQRKS